MAKQGKLVALAALVILCAWLVYHNLLSQGATPAASSSAANPPAAGRHLENALLASSSQAPGEAGRRDRTMDQHELAALDPTLRLDLLARVGQVKYAGSSRNIFQFYTPPPPIPKPVTSPILSSSDRPAGPPEAAIPLKFYGVASHPGSPAKQAFLIDGDDIYVGQEGDTVDKNYRITRIGVNTIELEDVRTKQRRQLPLVEE